MRIPSISTLEVTRYSTLGTEELLFVNSWTDEMGKAIKEAHLYSMRQDQRFSKHLVEFETTAAEMSAKIKAIPKYGDGLWDNIDPEEVIAAWRRRRGI